MSSDNENLNLKSDEELLNTTEDEQEEVNDSQKESNIEDSNLAEDEIDAGSDIDDDDDENQQDDGIEDDIDIGNDVDDDDDNDDESQQDDGIEDDINWDEADEDENEHENENVDDRFAEKFSDDDNDTDINNIDEETLKEEIQIEKGKQRKVFDNITPLTEEEINEYNDKVNKTGVLYMSHVPPYMRPYKVRILLSPFGEIGHMHFVEEDAALRRRRIRNGGNKKMKYTEGWIEFLNKKDAKKCASLLNGNVVGGKKLNFFHDDIWTLKYLKGFKWNNLVEKIAYEKRIRQDRLKTEFSQSRKADELYLENVEESKIYKKIQNKKNQKRNTNDMDNNNDDIHIKRVFKQKPTVQKDDSKQNKE